MTTPWIIAYAALWLVLFVISLLVVGVLRRVATVLEEAEERLQAAGATPGPGGLEPGIEVPHFRVQQLTGEWITDEDLTAEGSVVVFLSSDCPPCRSLAREIRRRPPTDLPLYLAVNSLDEAAELKLQDVSRVLVQSNRELSVAFRTSATHAFVVSADGVVLANSTPNTLQGLHKLAAPILEGGDAAEQHSDVAVPA